MKSKFGSFIVAISIVLGPGVAFAAAGWTDYGSITNLNQQPATGIGANLVFIDVSVTSNPSGCSVATGFYLSVSDERQKRFFATILAAQLSSRTVRIYTTGNCHAWGYAEMDGVVVQ